MFLAMKKQAARDVAAKLKEEVAPEAVESVPSMERCGGSAFLEPVEEICESVESMPVLEAVEENDAEAPDSGVTSLKDRLAQYAFEKAMLAADFSARIYTKSQEDERVRRITEFWLEKCSVAAATAKAASDKSWEHSQPHIEQLRETVGPHIDAWFGPSMELTGQVVVAAKDKGVAAASKLGDYCTDLFSKISANERLQTAAAFCVDTGCLAMAIAEDTRAKTQPMLEEAGSFAAAQLKSGAALAWEIAQPFVMEKGALLGDFLKITAQRALSNKSSRPMTRSEARKSKKAE